MNKIIRNFDYFKPIEKEGYVEVKFPVVIGISKCLLTLRITETDEGYIISDDGDLFYNASEETRRYKTIL